MNIGVLSGFPGVGGGGREGGGGAHEDRAALVGDDESFLRTSWGRRRVVVEGGARMNSNVKQKHRVTNGVYSRRHCFKWLSDARNLSRFATWQAPLNLFIHPRRRAPRPHFEKSCHYPVKLCRIWCSTGERGRLSPIRVRLYYFPDTMMVGRLIILLRNLLEATKNLIIIKSL